MRQSSIIPATFSLLISKLIPALFLTLINLIYARYLTQTDYGIYQTIWSFVAIFSLFTTFGLPRYIITFGNIPLRGNNSVVKVLGITFFISLLIVSIYLFCFSESLSLPVILTLIVLIASQAYYLIQEASVIYLLKNQQLVIANFLYALFLLVSHVFILYIGYQLIYCLLAITIVSIVRNIWMHRFLSNSITSTSRFNPTQLVWFGLNDSLQLATKWIDKLVLIFVFPSALYAVYFNGTYEIPLIGMGLSAFQSIITSFSAQAQNGESEQIDLFRLSSLFMSGILFPLFAFAVIYAQDIIHLLFSDAYEESVNLFVITSFLLPLRICSYTVLLQVKEKGKIILMGSLIDFVVAIVLMLFLYPYFGLEGLALAFVIATYIQAIFYVFYTQKIYKIGLSALFSFKSLFFRLIISVLVIYLIKLLVIPDSSYNFFIGILAFIFLVLYFVRKTINIKSIFPSLF